LEEELSNPDIWDVPSKALEKQKKLSFLLSKVKETEEIEKEIGEIKEIYSEVKVDASLEEEIKSNIENIKKRLKKEGFKVLLSGKFDRKDAIIEISSGAGGRDAEDFVSMLFRMYRRYGERKGFQSKMLSCSYGESGGPEGRVGIKNVSLEVKGDYAFGYLKKESGTHRLVRKSPFSSSSTRHTSFAQVEVFPIIDNNESQIKINEDELKIDTFRSSGPGGQHVNKRESAIRITHLPTGIVVSVQSERLQGENKRAAMKILRAKLENIEEKKKEQEIEKAKEKGDGASWGTQIRNYILHPYKMVKDLRTQTTTSNVENILDGDLDLLKDDFFQ